VPTRAPPWILAAFAFAVAWHVLVVVAGAWTNTHDVAHGRDFASYHYAVRAAADGEDPYDVATLNRHARDEGVRSAVHPYLYAPPFVLLMGWTRGYDLPGAFHTWFWLHALAGGLTAAFLAWWWRRWGGDELAAVVLISFALMIAVPNNHQMGQANFVGLGLALGGLALVERRSPVAGGVLMGAACMLKMSPALFVMWWALRREWLAVAVACITGLGLSIAALPLVGVEVQWRFFTEVLPSFGRGSYNGLRVPIGLFGNHSIPNLWNAALPQPGFGLSPLARLGSQLTALGLLASAAALFWRAPRGADVRAAQIACVGVIILLVPVFTYEHHLVFALPALAISTWAACTGRLPPALVPVVAASFVVVCFDLQAIKRMAEAPLFGRPWLAGPLRELKFAGLIGLLVATAYLGHGSPHDHATPDARGR